MSSHNNRREVVVITGASAGIGRATVRKFARHGAAIGLVARGRDGLEGAREDVERLGGRALVIPTDVADYEQVEAAAEQVERDLGPIDVWVNNAMVSVLSPFWRMTIDEFRRVTEVTYLGQVHGTYAALKRMMPRDRGVIVQVGSALAYRSIPLQSAYCGAKHGVLGFTESLRVELLHEKSNVAVRIVQLPGVNTPQFEWIKNKMPHTSRPAGKIYQPEVAADAIHWIAHNDRPELTVGVPAMQAIYADKVAPRLMDHYMTNVWEGHQTDQPEDPDRPNNLFTPVAGDHGAHGPFDDQSVDSSWQLWANKNRRLLTFAGAGLAAATIGAILGGRRFT